MIPLGAKKSGGKLIPHSVLGEGSVSSGSITLQETKTGYFVRNMEC
jgi:hypothetical protein